MKMNSFPKINLFLPKKIVKQFGISCHKLNRHCLASYCQNESRTVNIQGQNNLIRIDVFNKGRKLLGNPLGSCRHVTAGVVLENTRIRYNLTKNRILKKYKNWEWEQGKENLLKNLSQQTNIRILEKYTKIGNNVVCRGTCIRHWTLDT